MLCSLPLWVGVTWAVQLKGSSYGFPVKHSNGLGMEIAPLPFCEEKGAHASTVVLSNLTDGLGERSLGIHS